jgi:hypothetical protein
MPAAVADTLRRPEPLVWGHGSRVFEVFLEPMAAVGAHREEFEFERHCRGPNLDATPRHIITRIERYSGLDLAEAFMTPGLDREIKWHCRYARQNGIHVSPTFMVNGLVQADLSSGDDVAHWASRLLQD